MERLRNMDLKRSLFFLSTGCVLLSLLLVLLVFQICGRIRANYPTGGISYTIDGTTTILKQPTDEEQRMQELLTYMELFSCVFFPFAGLGFSGVLFYHIKLKKPIILLREGTAHIQTQDLNFSIPEVSTDELGQICAAFETMRLELLKTNRELWQQAEDRKRLNAAFAHDLRNPITVLKGSIKLLRQDVSDRQALERMESYTLRIEQYVEAMSGIERLEQMPVRAERVEMSGLRADLEETARLLAPSISVIFSAPEGGVLWMDRGIFMMTAENLIGNGARFAKEKLTVTLAFTEDRLSLTVADDGSGFPEKLLEEGPKPFGKTEGGGEHFGMGLYNSSLLCVKHGGSLRLKNNRRGGASATAVFQMYCKS